MRKLLKITPIALLAVLCFAFIVNVSPVTPKPVAPSDWLRRSISTRTLGPPLDWGETYGNTSTDMFEDVVQCTGGYAMVGRTTSWGEGNYDVYLVKVDNTGTLVFNKTFGGGNADYGEAIVAVSDGFVIAGYTNSFGPTGANVWLIKTDLNGNHLWNRTYGGSESDYGKGLVVSADGNFTIVGYTYFTSQYDTWLIHTNSTGHVVWEDHYGNAADDDIGYDLVECTGGGYAICGYTLNYGVVSAAAWVLRVNPTGGYLWNQTYDGGGYEHGNSIIERSSGGFAIAGHTDSYGATDDFWLIKTDASGNHQWNATYDNGDDDQAEDMIEYSEGGFALAGFSVTPTTLRHSASPRGFNPYDGWLVRTDASGNQLWNRTDGDGDTGYDKYLSLIEGSGGEILCAGHTDSIGAGDYDGWLTQTRNVLFWYPDPADQTLAYGTSLHYDLNVSSYFTTAIWTINDTTNFAISSAGIVTNAIVLASGDYPLQVTVTDTAGCMISGEFVVTVEAPIISPIPLELILIAVLAVIIIIVIVLLLYYFVLRKRK